MTKKYFTLNEANQLLPYVQNELAFLQETKRNFYKTYQELQQLKKKHPQKTNDSVNTEDVFTLECRLEFMEMETQMHMQHISAQGIQIKDLGIGLFDFPAILDGQEVLLCWCQGEAAITHYHGIDEGFTGRKDLNRLD